MFAWHQILLNSIIYMRKKIPLDPKEQRQLRGPFQRDQIGHHLSKGPEKILTQRGQRRSIDWLQVDSLQVELWREDAPSKMEFERNKREPAVNGIKIISHPPSSWGNGDRLDFGEILWKSECVFALWVGATKLTPDLADLAGTGHPSQHEQWCIIIIIENPKRWNLVELPNIDYGVIF